MNKKPPLSYDDVQKKIIKDHIEKLAEFFVKNTYFTPESLQDEKLWYVEKNSEKHRKAPNEHWRFCFTYSYPKPYFKGNERPLEVGTGLKKDYLSSPLCAYSAATAYLRDGCDSLFAVAEWFYLDWKTSEKNIIAKNGADRENLATIKGRRDQQVQLILEVAAALYENPMTIPTAGKKEILSRCEALAPELFDTRDATRAAWKEANTRKVVSIEDKAKYLSRD